MSTKLQRYKKLKANGKTTLSFDKWLIPKHWRNPAKPDNAAYAQSLVDSVNGASLKELGL